jgi:hypothetical protein
MTRYAICRTDASSCRGWFWAGAGCWTSAARAARTFELVTNAELIGIVECPFPSQQWDVVPVENPECAAETGGPSVVHDDGQERVIDLEAVAAVFDEA